MFYDYKCKECGKEQEEVHGMTENPEIKCSCGEIMRRIITGGTGVHYKGVGWPRKGTGTDPKPRRITEKVLIGKPQTPSPEKILGPILKKIKKK